MTELLLSNSRAPGQAFLEHAAAAVRSVLGGRKALAGLGVGVPPANSPSPTRRSRPWYSPAWPGFPGRPRPCW